MPAAIRAPFDLVVVAGSTGSFAVLEGILSGLPAAFPVPVAVVRHISPRHASFAAALLRRHCPLAIEEAAMLTRPRSGAVYLAPPDRHLLVRPGGYLSTERSARVHFTRPAADPLFTSAARAHGSRVLALVLSGLGCDGSRGLAAVKAVGGVTIVQAPATCEAPGMPVAAIQIGAVDFVLPPPAITAALVALCMVPGAARYFSVPAAAPRLAS